MNPASRHRVAALLCLFLLAAHSAPLRADGDAKKIYQHSLRATAFVVAQDVGTGTAWVVDRAEKLLITNHHVVEHRDQVLILFPTFQNGRPVSEKSAYKDERGLRGKVIDTDVARDLALVQLIDPLPEGTVELKLAVDSAEPTDRLHSLGNPAASDALWVYTSGTVRAVYQKSWATLGANGQTVFQRSCRVMETQSPVNPGDSGGAVLNDKAEVVAVVSSGREKHGNRAVHLMNWCIDVRDVRAFLTATRPLLNPKTALDYNRRGDRRYLQRRYDEAIGDYTEAMRLDKESAWAYRGRGLTFSRKKDWDTAIADSTRAIQLDPDDASSYENRAFAYAEKSEVEKALADYTRAIQLNPKYALAYNNRGHLHYTRRDLDRAITDYSRAIELDPSFSMAYQNRAEAYHSTGTYDKALQDATSALKLNPSLVHAWTVRGWSLMGQREYDRAIENFNEAVQLHPRTPTLYLYRGNALTWKNQWNEAIANYSQAITLNPKYAAAYYWRAAAYESSSRDHMAQADYTKAIELNPDYAKQLKTLHSRYLKVVNERSETLRVYVQYEYQNKDNVWRWWPEAPGGKVNYWDIAPGKETYLLDDGWKVKARRVRIWAVGQSSQTTFTKYKDTDLWLAPTDGYRARSETTFTFTFFK